MRVLLTAALILLVAVSTSEAGQKKQFPNKAAVVKLVADTLYLEAGGESNEGKLGVASVISNRSSTWTDLPHTILAKRQFSCWNGKSPRAYHAPNNESYQYCLLVAKDVVSGKFVAPEKFRGVVSYHEQSVRPQWRKTMVVATKVDHHYFYREKGFFMVS